MLRFRPGQNLLPLLASWFFPLLTVFGHLSMSGSFSLNRIPFGVLSFEKRSETSLKEFSGIGYTVQLSRIGVFLSEQRRSGDLNPGTVISRLLPFQGSPFNLLGTSPNQPTTSDWHQTAL